MTDNDNKVKDEDKGPKTLIEALEETIDSELNIFGQRLHGTIRVVLNDTQRAYSEMGGLANKKGGYAALRELKPDEMAHIRGYAMAHLGSMHDNGLVQGAALSLETEAVRYMTLRKLKAEIVALRANGLPEGLDPNAAETKLRDLAATAHWAADRLQGTGKGPSKTAVEEVRKALLKALADLGVKQEVA